MTTQYGAPLTGAQMTLLRAAGLPDGTNTSYRGWEFLVEELTLGDKEYYLPADHAAYTLLEAGWLDGRNVALWFGGEKAPDDLLEDSDVLLANGEMTFGYERWKHDGDECDIIAYTRKAEYREETVKACQSFDETITLNKMTEAVSTVEWGPELTVNWQRPDWLPAEGQVLLKKAGCWDNEADVSDADDVQWSNVETIQFPADHPIYNNPPAAEKLKEEVRLSRELIVEDDTVTLPRMTEAEACKKAFEFITFPYSRTMPEDHVYETFRQLGLIKPEPTCEDRFWASQPNGGAHLTDDIKAWVREALNFECSD